MSGRHTDLVGQRFSNLVVLSIEANPGSHYKAICRCDCGKEKAVRVSHILSGRQHGCGCGRSHTLTHGKSRTKIYAIWRMMRSRCENDANPKYSYYGARGIKVCERWKKFENFYADMGDQPAGMMLERLDGNGGYEPSNCKWATRVEQNNNTSRNHRVVYRDQKMTVAQVMRISGSAVPERTVYSRLHRGVDIERAIQ